MRAKAQKVSRSVRKLGNLSILVAIALAGLIASSAGASSQQVVRNNGYIGEYVQGTGGETHFRGVEIVSAPEDSLCGSTVRSDNFNGQVVCGTNGERRLRGTVGDFQSQNAYPGGESIPVGPNACVDTEGRQRSERPCRGN